MTEEDWCAYFDGFIEDAEMEEFYNLMHAYRHHPGHDPEGVSEAFARVKSFLGKLIKDLR